MQVPSKDTEETNRSFLIILIQKNHVRRNRWFWCGSDPCWPFVISMFFPRSTGGHAGTRKTKRGKRCRCWVVIWLRVCIDYSVCKEFWLETSQFPSQPYRQRRLPKWKRRGCDSHVLGDHCPVQFVKPLVSQKKHVFSIPWFTALFSAWW